MESSCLSNVPLIAEKLCDVSIMLTVLEVTMLVTELELNSAHSDVLGCHDNTQRRRICARMYFRHTLHTMIFSYV